MTAPSSDQELLQRLRQLEASDARLHTELAAAVEREASLARIAQRINEHPLDIDGTLLAIAEAARALTNGDAARVFLRDGEQLVAKLGAIAGEAVPARYAEASVQVDLSTSVLPMARCVRERRTIAMADAQELAKSIDDPMRREQLSANLAALGIRSQMATPLGRAEPIAGALVIVRNQVRPFDSTEMATLEAFAAQAAIAIETARAQRELAQRNREVTEALETQTVMAQVLEIIAASPSDLDAVLPQLAGAAARLCGADTVVVSHGAKGATARFWKTGVGNASAPASGRGRGVPGARAIATNAPVRVAGPIDTWEDDYPDTASMLRASGYSQAAFLAVPLRSDAGPVGTIVVGRYSAIPFTDRHVAILETFASQALIAIENARLFDELQATTEQLGRINVELAAASKHKSDFLANMSHELRTPLNAIIGYSELLQEEAEDIGEASFVADLGKIGSAARHQLRLINDILDLSKIEAGKMTLNMEAFDITGMLREVQARDSAAGREEGQRVRRRLPG